MHSLLEGYLEEVAGHLGALPAARRVEELREMRTHLENAVIVGREMGRTEDEAVKEALAQFGTPAELSDNLVWVWRRERTRDWRVFWGAAASGLFLSFYPPPFFLGFDPVQNLLITLIPWGPVGTVDWSMLTASVIVHALGGGLCGLMFPKRALRGTLLGILGSYGVFVAVLFVTSRTAWAFDLASRWAGQNAIPFLSAAVAAGAVSRWRTAGPGRRYQSAAK